MSKPAVMLGRPPRFFAQLRAEAGDFAERWRSCEDRGGGRSPNTRHMEAATAVTVFAGLFLVTMTLDPGDLTFIDRFAPRWGGLAEIVTRLGLSGYIFAASAAVLLVALWARAMVRDRLASASFGLLAGRSWFIIVVNAVSGAASQLLKHMFRRARPHLMEGPYHFDLFSIKANLASFPSGHTVTAVATASALGMFIPALRVPLYVLAVSVGISRLVLLAHFPSDVLAGAALGYGATWFIGRAFARRRIVLNLRGGRTSARALGAPTRALRQLLRSRQ